MERLLLFQEEHNGIRTVELVRLTAAGSYGRFALTSDPFHPRDLSLFVCGRQYDG